ncbi:MAG: bifunctional adenosylcobinamide kinase/adenosylcobinamide-phosphate guanylyltransferase [Ilumatobacteraceae bacterium]
MGTITFLVGGARSGKSALAVELGRRHGGEVVVVATAEAFDDDLRDRIARHRAERPAWPTIEEPLDLAGAVRRAPAGALLIVDCLTVWLGNVLHAGATGAAIDTDAATAELVDTLLRRDGPSVVISNEVGLGLVPDTPLGRTYRDLLGRINQAAAAAATTSLLLVAGRATVLRDPWEML